MGLITYPISINIKHFHQSVLGQKDDLLYDAITHSPLYLQLEDEQSFKREIKDLLFNYKQPENRNPTPKKLFGLIKANDDSGLEGEWNDYGYALLCICSVTGKPFETNDYDYVYSEQWWEINTKLREINSKFDLNKFTENVKVFDTPYNQHDIYTNYLSHSEVSLFILDLDKIAMNINESKNPLFTSLKNGLTHALINNNDVVFFSFEKID